jgi:hypothetical protein
VGVRGRKVRENRRRGLGEDICIRRVVCVSIGVYYGRLLCEEIFVSIRSALHLSNFADFLNLKT